MLRAAITIGCAAAVVAACTLVVRLRHTRRTPSPLTGQEPFGERLAVTVGRTGGMLAGASLGGVLAIGAGSRLMMRVLAATSSDGVQGLRTDAGETIGDVTVGGSVFLILVVGIGAGVVGLAIFATLRRWLPDHSVLAGLICVAIGAGLLVRPSGLIASGNGDFALLDPVALAAAMCIAMVILLGATVGVLVDRLGPMWPRPGRSLRGIASLLPFAVLALSPPLFIAAIVGVLGGAVAPTLRSSTRPSASLATGNAAGSRPARVLVATAGVLGGASVLVAAEQVLAL